MSETARLPAPTARRLLGVAWLVAVVATAGSLFYSLGLGFYPCELCWYQRILMYPLVVLFGYAVVRGHHDVYLAALPLSVLGIGVSAYQSYLQVASGATCSVGGCSVVHLRVLGLTIPNQAFVGFVLVTAAMAWLWRLRDPSAR